MHINAFTDKILQCLNLQAEAAWIGAGQFRELRLGAAFETDSDVNVFIPGQILGIGFIIADENTVCFKNEKQIFRDKLKYFNEVPPSNGGFVAAYSNLAKALLTGNPCERSDYALW